MDKQAHTYAVYKRPTSDLETESEGIKKVFHANGNQKKTKVAILIQDKIDFKIKTVMGDKKEHYMIIKG